MNQVIYIGTSLVTDTMTNDELAAICNAITDSRFDPREVMGYEKAKSLFTEEYKGIPQMHNATKQVFIAITNGRLGN